MGVLDPAGNQTRDYPEYKWLEARTGDHIRLLRDGDQMVFVR